MIPLSSQPDAHGIVGGAELHHVHALHGEQRVQVFHGRCLLDHDGHHRVVEGLHEGGRAHVHDIAHVAAHAHAVETAVSRCLRPRRGDALRHVGGRARVGEEQVLDAGADGPHPEIGPRLLLDLHHGRHVRKGVHGAREILEGEEIVGRVLSRELHVVEEAGVARQLDGGRPRRVDMGAEGGLPRAQELAKLIGTHGMNLLWRRGPGRGDGGPR